MSKNRHNEDTIRRVNRQSQTNPLAETLGRLRARARRLLLAERLGLTAAAALAALAALALADWALRFPAPLRAALLVAAFAALAWIALRLIAPAARFAPSLTDIALRVEHATPSLKGRLASALEFAGWNQNPAQQPHNSTTTRALAARVAAAAAELAAKVSPHAVLKPDRARKGLAAAAIATARAAAFAAVMPAAAATAAARLLTPWSDAAWPKRTGVADATNRTLAPRGESLTLRALAWRTTTTTDPNAPTDTAAAEVTLEWRERTESRPAQTVREIATWQGAAERLLPDDRLTTALADARAPASARPRAGLYERPIRSSAPAIHYPFLPADDATPWQRVTLADRPAIINANARLSPPDYTAPPTPPPTIELGNGRDERAIAPPALAGTRAAVTVTTNLPATITATINRRDNPASAPTETTRTLQTEPAENNHHAATLNLTLKGELRLSIALQSDAGLRSRAPAVFRFQGVPDRPPAATVTRPTRDETVLPTAVIDARAEGRDDVRLTALRLTHQLFRPPNTATGGRAALDPITDPVTAASLPTNNAPAPAANISAPIDLTTLDNANGALPGDRVELRALAEDDQVGKLPAAEPTRSAPRTLRVVSRADFTEELRAGLNAVRQAAKRTDAQQQSTAQTARAAGPTPAVRRDQARIADRAQQQSRALDEIADRAERNRLQDPRLDDILQTARDALDRAADASEPASEALSRQAAAAQDPPQPRAA